MKQNSNDISYETTEPIFMKYHIQHLYEMADLILMKFHIQHHMMVIQDLAKKVMIRNSRWPSCPYIVKTFNRLLQNHWADLADILQEA